MSITETVNKIWKSMFGENGFVSETADIAVAGGIGAFAPIALGALGAISPAIALNPLNWFYTAGLAATAVGVSELDSLIGKLAMGAASVLYFLPNTLEYFAAGLITPSLSSSVGALSAGAGAASGYITSIASTVASSITPYLPQIGLTVAALGLAYIGYRFLDGITSYITGPEESKPKKAAAQPLS